MFLNFLPEDHVQAEVRRIFFSPSSAHLQPSTSASTEGDTNSARSVVASLRQHGLREEFVSDDIQDVKFDPKNQPGETQACRCALFLLKGQEHTM